MRGYAEFLRERHVKHLIVGNIVGRLPNGMGPLVVALYLRTLEIDYWLVGLLTSLYGLSAALGGPLLGRFVDVYGQARVLLLSMVCSTLGFLVLSVTSSQHLVAAIAAIVVAGLFTPPLEPCLRSLWPTVLRTRTAVNAAYALDAALQEVIFVVGPLLVVALVNQLGASAAVLLTGVVALLGTVTFVAAPPVRAWQPQPRTADWAGPLRSSTLRVLLLSFLCVGCALGTLNLAVVAYSEAQHATALSGGLLGANSFGALVGGLIYGSRTWSGNSSTRLTWLMFGLAAGYAPLMLVPQPILMLVLAVLSGLFLAPGLACAFVVIGENVPGDTATEAFAWLITVFMLGNALGSSVAGSVLQSWGIHAAFLAPAFSALLAALVLVASARFRPAQRQKAYLARQDNRK